MAEVTDGVQSEVSGLFGRDGLYVLMWGVQLLATALFTPINTRLLGAGGYGRVTIALSVMMIVFSFASLSIASAVQKVFADDGGPEKARRLVTASIWIAVVVTALADLSGPYWSHALGFGGYGGAIHYGVIMAGVSSMTSVCLGYLRSQDRLLAFSGISLLQTVVAEALSVLLVLSVTHRTAGVYVMGQLLAQVAATVAALVLVRPLLFRRRDLEVLRQGLTYCLPLVPSGLATFILTAGDRFVLQRQLGSTSVGRYQVAYNLGGMTIILLGVLNIVWMPRLFAIKDRPTQATVLLEARDTVYKLLVPVLVGLSVAGPVLLHFWVPPSYYPDRLGLVLVVVAVSALPFAGYQAHSRVLLLSGNTLAMAWTMVVAAALNIALNLILVPLMGITGSALATFVAYFVLSSLVRMSADRVIKLERIKGRVVVAALAGAGLGLLSTRLPTSPDWLWIRFGVGAVCGVVFVLQLRGLITGKRVLVVEWPIIGAILRRCRARVAR